MTDSDRRLRSIPRINYRTLAESGRIEPAVIDVAEGNSSGIISSPGLTDNTNEPIAPAPAAVEAALSAIIEVSSSSRVD